MPWPSFRLSPEQLDHLPTEIDDLAIGLGLSLITTDDADAFRASAINLATFGCLPCAYHGAMKITKIVTDSRRIIEHRLNLAQRRRNIKKKIPITIAMMTMVIREDQPLYVC